MGDMLVKLYDVKPDNALEEKLQRQGILIKRAIAPDLSVVRAFADKHFSVRWGDECVAGILRGGCYIAVKDKAIIGFACYDATMPDYFGPTGVREDMRGLGLGRLLLLKALLALRDKGYRYAIIGWAGPTAFYEKNCGAVDIPDSAPASYAALHDVERMDAADLLI